MQPCGDCGPPYFGVRVFVIPEKALPKLMPEEENEEHNSVEIAEF